MEIAFRDATPADALLLARLFRASFVATFGHLYHEQDLVSFLTSHGEAAWREQLQSSDYAIRIAEAGGHPIAFAKVGPLSLPVENAVDPIELKQFYVLEPWQGKGVARPLMEWVLGEARARGAGEIYLSVWSGNHRAQRFYRSFGFAFVAPYLFMVGRQADEDEIFRLELGPKPE